MSYNERYDWLPIFIVFILSSYLGTVVGNLYGVERASISANNDWMVACGDFCLPYAVDVVGTREKHLCSCVDGYVPSCQ